MIAIVEFHGERHLVRKLYFGRGTLNAIEVKCGASAHLDCAFSIEFASERPEGLCAACGGEAPRAVEKSPAHFPWTRAPNGSYTAYGWRISPLYTGRKLTSWHIEYNDRYVTTVSRLRQAKRRAEEVGEGGPQ